MDINVKNGQVLTITESSWPDKITSLNADGDLLITNGSNDVKLLEFSKELDLVVTGKMSVTGKMVELATASGEYGQIINSPIKGHVIPALWIEKTPNSGKYEQWRCINAGALDYKFSDFAAKEKVGKVFRCVNDQLVFSDKEGNSLIPAKDCKIMIPNIVMSVEGGETSNPAYFQSNSGGIITLRKVIASTFDVSLSGFAKAVYSQVGVVKPLGLSYISSLSCSDIISVNDSNYSSGFVISYCSEPILENILAQSVKNYGAILQYVAKPTFNNILGIIIKRDSSTDYGVLLETVSDATMENIYTAGGSLAIQNGNNVIINNIFPSDNVLYQNNGSYGQKNIVVSASNNINLNGVYIDKGSAASESIVEVSNSSKVNVVKVKSEDKNVDSALSLAVASESKFAQFNIAGVNDTNNPIDVDNKSINNVFQNISIKGADSLFYGGIGSLIKGVSGTDVTILDGAYNTIFAQLQNEDNSGKLIVRMTQNNFSKTIEGNPTFLYGEGLVINKNDIVDIKIPTSIGGIQFKGVPKIEGGNSDLRVFFKVLAGTFESDYLLLTEDNLESINNDIKSNLFNLIIRVDGSALADNTKLQISKVTIPTEDDKIVYPVFFKEIILNFDKLIQSDSTAVFGLMFKDTYNNGKGIFLRDKNGEPIMGSVDGRSKLVYKYDYQYDNTAGRVPGKDFDVVAVLNSQSLTAPAQLTQTITKEGSAAVSFNYNKDKAFEIFMDTIKNKG